MDGVPAMYEELAMQAPSSTDVILLTVNREIVFKSPFQTAITEKLPKGTQRTLEPHQSESATEWLITTQPPTRGLPLKQLERLESDGAIDLDILEFKKPYFP